jgi:hypothetical protein
VAAAAANRRRGSAHAARKAGKQRRQTIIVVVLAVVLALLLAYEVPHTLKLLDNSPSSAPAASSESPTQADAQVEAKTLPPARTGADPFAAKSLPNGDPQPAAATGPDPFTAPAPAPAPPSPPAAAATASAAAPPATAPEAMPKQIVIGRPGGHRVATRSWIVILASIPTRAGQQSAVRFARGARGNVGALSVLNSSNRRPLRGGYWVVYSGPYATLGTVSRRAGDVHAAGYRTAYIRELITYR